MGNGIIIDNSAKFLSHRPVWQHRCKANESLGQKMDQMDADSAIDPKMLRIAVRRRFTEHDDLD